MSDTGLPTNNPYLLVIESVVNYLIDTAPPSGYTLADLKVMPPDQLYGLLFPSQVNDPEAPPLPLDIVNLSQANRLYVQDVIEQVLADPATTVANLKARVAAQLLSNEASQTSTNQIISGVVSPVTQSINDAVGQISQQTQALNSTITQNTNTTLAGMSNLISDAQSAIGGQISSGLGQTDSVLSNGFSEVQNSLGNQNSLLGSILQKVVGAVTVNVSNNIKLDSSIYGTVLGAITGIVNQNTVTLGGVVGAIGKSIENTVGLLIAQRTASANTETQALLSIVAAILHNKDKNTGILNSATDPGPNGMGGVLAKAAAAALGQFLNVDAATLQKSFEVALPTLDQYCVDTVDQLQQATDAVIDSPDANINAKLAMETLSMLDQGVQKLVMWFVTFVMHTYSNLSTVMQIGAAKAQNKLYAYYVCHPSVIMTPPDAIRAYQYGLLDTTTLALTLRANGYSKSDADRLVGASYQVPDINTLFSANLRGDITDDALDNLLAKLGYDSEMRKVIEEQKFFIPPPQDLITMAVREVFKPQTSIPFGQYEEFDPQFGDWAKKQGISDYWARSYWAAHWNLPSAEMGFEMLHRGAIQESDLDTLIAALDVMPFWREPLKQIAYTPIDRIDIRRLNAYGLMDVTQVQVAYQHLGYSPVDAALMAEFTVALNTPKKTTSASAAHTLSVTTTVSFYRDGAIDRATAESLLVTAGLDTDTANLYLDDADLKSAQALRKQQVADIMTRVRSESMLQSDANDALSQLDLSAEELAHAQADLASAVASITKLPSRTDLDAMFKAGLIDATTFTNVMIAHGYSVQWANNYLKLAGG